MSVELKVTLSSGREVKLTYSEAVEMRNTLNQFADTFQRNVDSASKYHDTPRLVQNSSIKPTSESVLQYIRNKPRYEHSQVELENIFYGRRLPPSSPMWESLYHQARTARMRLANEEKIEWETVRGEKNGDGKRAPRIYRKVGDD